MLKKILSGAVALSILAGAGAASAAPYNSHNDSRWNGGGYSQDRNDRGDYRNDRGYHGPQANQRHWRRGERLPTAYRGRGYAVDYRAHHLRAPPRGYQYTRYGNDVVLTAIATGIIAAVIANAFN